MNNLETNLVLYIAKRFSSITDTENYWIGRNQVNYIRRKEKYKIKSKCGKDVKSGVWNQIRK